ncbi:MAG TPA: hypothetical protein VLL30_10450 [Reyranella sp.]|jgi:hypothetical protein|nr:hypothetical protein [Reyranella sp.]
MTAVSIGTPTSAQSRKAVTAAVVSTTVIWGLKETAFDELA